jgi:hypothetical protein
MSDTAASYQFNARHVTIDDDGSTIVIGFADDEFSPSRYVVIQKPLNADERDRAMGFDKIHIQIEGELRSGYGGIVEVSVSRDRLTVFLDQAARSALKIDGDIEISFEPHHPAFRRAISKLKTMCEENEVVFLE